MTIKAGENIPEANVSVMGENGPSTISTNDIFLGKRIVLFAVPGAFTPGCSMTHLPGYVTHADKILSKGIDTIICMAVNDAFVMDAWGKEHGASSIMMLADGNGDFTKALGLELDGSAYGLGQRSQRFSMLVEDAVVSKIQIEDGPGIDVSSAESILALL